MAKKFDVSVCVAIYNSDPLQLFMTLASMIRQKQVSFEVIVADDGSVSDMSEQIRAFFKAEGFEDYKILRSEKNNGTVINYLRAAVSSSGKYIKCISAGDLFYSETSLSELMRYMERNSLDACFTDAVYYNSRGLPEVSVDPQIVWVHRKRYLYLQKLCYLILSDRACGAAWLVRREEFLRYMRLFANKVRFCEDSIYCLMIMDEKRVGYHYEPSIYYHYGDGLSTAQNETWTLKLREDDNAVNLIQLRRCRGNSFFEKRYRFFLRFFDARKRLINIVLKMFVFPEVLPLWILQKTHRRKNVKSASFAFLEECRSTAEKFML